MHTATWEKFNTTLRIATRFVHLSFWNNKYTRRKLCKKLPRLERVDNRLEAFLETRYMTSGMSIIWQLHKHMDMSKLYRLFLRSSRKFRNVFWSHKTINKSLLSVRCDAMWSSRSLTTFWRNVQSSISRTEIKPSNHLAPDKVYLLFAWLTTFKQNLEFCNVKLYGTCTKYWASKD
jgi:hypothetical protein